MKSKLKKINYIFLSIFAVGMAIFIKEHNEDRKPEFTINVPDKLFNTAHADTAIIESRADTDGGDGMPMN